MPISSKLQFTTQHYILKTPTSVSNYDPDNNVIKAPTQSTGQTNGPAPTTSGSTKSY